MSPYFSMHYCQRGSGSGVLAAGFELAALPKARKSLSPFAKKIGREIIVHPAPAATELDETVTKNYSNLL